MNPDELVDSIFHATTEERDLCIQHLRDLVRRDPFRPDAPELWDLARTIDAVDGHVRAGLDDLEQYLRSEA